MPCIRDLRISLDMVAAVGGSAELGQDVVHHRGVLRLRAEHDQLGVVLHAHAVPGRHIAYTRGFASAMKPWSTGRAYLNFIGDEGSSRVEAAFGSEKYAHLARLKREWDPENLFRHNQNIAPAPVG